MVATELEIELSLASHDKHCSVSVHMWRTTEAEEKMRKCTDTAQARLG